MDTIDFKISDLLIRMDQKLDRLGGQVGNLETRLGSLETKMEAVEGAISALDTKVDRVQEKVGTLETRMAAIETVLPTLATKEGGAQIRGEIQALDKAIAGIDTRIQFQEFLTKTVAGGLTLAALGGFLKWLGVIN